MRIYGNLDRVIRRVVKADSSIISQLAFYASLFLISGSAGLIYQVVWEKLLQLYFGVTTLSVIIIVAAYMCGLGLGSLIGGHISQKLKSTLASYGYLEVGIGFFGLVSPSLLVWVGRVTAGSSYWIVFGLSFCLLLIPTVLMGATLPLLSQAFIRRVETSGEVVGVLYGINTFGAAIGALISGYLLIGWLGLNGAVIIAVMLNIGVGIAALGLSRRSPKTAAVHPLPDQPLILHKQPLWGYRTILLAAFLTGFIGLGYEMLWVRVLNIINKHSAYNFPTILFIFLTGLALGGYLLGKKADRSRRPTDLFWKVELLVGVLGALSFLSLWLLLDYAPLTSRFQAMFFEFQRPPNPFIWLDDQLVFAKRKALADMLAFLIPPMLLIFPTALVMGGGLIILDRIAIESHQMAGRRVGDVHLANIIGSVLGTLLVGLVFLPYAGTELTLKFLVAGSLIFFLLNIRSRLKLEISPESSKLDWSLVLIVLVLVALLPGRGSYYAKIFHKGTNSAVILNEDRDGVLAFTGVSGGELPQHLWIGGEIHSFFPPNGVYESRALACAGASQPERVLIIGLGGGNTAYFYSQLPGVQEIVIVELFKNLAPFLEQHLDTVNALLDNPKVKLITDDGRRFLYANPEELFDLITTDPVRSYNVGHNNLYSKEALGLYRTHLSDSGVLCLWTDEFHILPLTTASVFPHVDDYDDFIIASSNPIHYELDYMHESAQIYLNSPGIILETGIADLLSPFHVLSRFIRDQDRIMATEEGKPVLSDLAPRLEYYYFPAPYAPTSRHKESTLSSLLYRVHGCPEHCQAEIMKR